VSDFSYLDLYATEGPSFLLVVGYLVLLIVFAKALFSDHRKKTDGSKKDGHA
jgi:hypothetical protein